MSAQKEAYVDVTAQPSPSRNPLNKAAEAKAARDTRLGPSSDPPPPAYSGPSAPGLSRTTSSTLPPYDSLASTVTAEILSLREGDPKEVISVPMIHSTRTTKYKKLLSKERTAVSQTVIVRKMPREHYLKHYAKDAESNYVGTDKAAADAGLVFVPSKSTPEDILQQVHSVAFGKMHHATDFGTGGAYVPFAISAGGFSG